MAIRNLTQGDAEALLNDLREGLSADGYDLEVSSINDKVALRIVVAREDVCEDCLVPKEIMSQMAAVALQEKFSDITPDDIVFQYPAKQ